MSIIAPIVLVYLLLGLVTFVIYVTRIETDITISLISYFLCIMAAWPLFVPILWEKSKDNLHE
jgi:hypothetical protein